MNKFKIGDKVIPLTGTRVYTVAKVLVGVKYGDWFLADHDTGNAGYRNAEDYNLSGGAR